VLVVVVGFVVVVGILVMFVEDNLDLDKLFFKIK